MLGTLIHYLRGTRIMMFQLSGFYYAEFYPEACYPWLPDRPSSLQGGFENDSRHIAQLPRDSNIP